MGELYRDNNADTTRTDPPPIGEQRRAVRVVCASAPDAGAALELIDALGLGDGLASLGELRALGRGAGGTP
jgi:hypothetical protein